MAKKIRDPHYNYIELGAPFMLLVNTPEFQRLRNIRQTSYEALYPSALHNRFVHSLGVFYLGHKAIDYFWVNISGVLSKDFKGRLAGSDTRPGEWAGIRETFLYACLLHDVGHSPFSHTGEQYYTKGILFEDELKKAVCGCQRLKGSKASKKYKCEKNCSGWQFCRDMDLSDIAPGAPHEAMSALIGLELCEKHGIQIDRELFVRCIIGVKYQSSGGKSQEETAFLNAVIGLLNGALIDVDKLDYTIRDSYVTGYNSLSIDLDRLLAGYTLYQENGKYYAGYKKGSLSVIENVIYANDLERRWIQNHPTILYDNQLVDTLLGRFDSYMRNKCRKKSARKKPLATVFTKQSLSQDGMAELDPPLKLLNDADILAYIKNIDTSEAAKQYLNRAERLKPLWKTEAAFTPLSRDFGEDLLRAIQNDFKSFLDIIQGRGESFINAQTLCFLRSRLQANAARADQQAIHICEIFQNFQAEYHLPDFQFMLIQTKRFRSNYLKLSAEGGEPVKVELDTGYFPLEEVMSVQAKKSASNINKDFFCVYTTRENVQKVENLGVKFFDFLRRNYKRAT